MHEAVTGKQLSLFKLEVKFALNIQYLRNYDLHNHFIYLF